MTTVWIIVGVIVAPPTIFGIGYEVGRAHAERVRRRFVQSLIGGDHSDLDEDEDCGCRRVRVRRGVRVGGLHSQSSTDTEACNHVR